MVDSLTLMLVAAVVILAAALVFVVALLYAQIRKAHRGAAAQGTEPTDFFASYLRGLSRILSQRTGLTNYVFEMESEDGPLEFDQVLFSIEKYLSTCLEETKSIFERSTQSKCSCSIKLIQHFGGDDNGVTQIHTYMRDSASSTEREQTDKDVPFIGPEDHSPFYLLARDPDKPRGFVSNDLKSLSEQGLYRNSNSNWNNFYNATCVVPIAVQDVNGGRQVLGFLCVDSQTGRFDREFSLAILEIVAGALYYTFESMVQLEELYGSDAQDDAEQSDDRVNADRKES